MKRRQINSKQKAFVTGMALCAFALTVGTGYAQEVKKVGTSAASFLRIHVGARASSMGGAFVSIADDPTSLFWNPGGVSRIGKYALTVDHSPWLPKLLTFNFVGLALPVSRDGAVGLSVAALSTDDMLVTTPSRPMGTGETFDAASIVVGVTYGHSLTNRFSIGGTFKYVTERIMNSSATGFAFDIGTIYDTPFSGIRLGVSVSNFGTKMRMNGEDLNVRVDIAPDQEGNNQSIVGQLKTDAFDLPLIMRVGLSWDALQMDNHRLTIAVDGLNPNDNAQSVNVGAEYALFKELLLFRCGFNELFLKNREKGFTAGAGVNIRMENGFGIRASYGYQSFQHLAGVNRFTLTLMF